jgi:hypothetical protein
MTRWLACLSVALLLPGSVSEASAEEHSALRECRDSSRPCAGDLNRLRRALQRPAVLATPRVRTFDAPAAPSVRRQSALPQRRDSVWNGALIGAAIGGAGGYLWARNICGGTDDTECFVISAPVGILGGIGIGAAAGAIADALHD